MSVVSGRQRPHTSTSMNVLCFLSNFEVKRTGQKRWFSRSDLQISHCGGLAQGHHNGSLPASVRLDMLWQHPQFLQIVALVAPETARSNPRRHVAQQLVNWFLLRLLNVLAMRDLWHHVNPVVHFIHNYVMDPLDKLRLWLAPGDSDALHDGLFDDLPPV